MILVTGSTGQSGSLIVEALSRAGAPCRALVRDTTKAAKLPRENVEIVQGNLADPQSLDRVMRGVDKLMLIPPPSQDIVALETVALESARRAGVKQIVKFSAAGASVNSPVRFGRMHGQSEQNIRKSGLSWTFLRPTFFMQNFLGMAGMIKGGTIYYDAADGAAPFVDLADVAAVAAMALTTEGHAGQTYELTGPASLTYAQVAEIFTRALGKPIRYQPIPHAACEQAMIQAGVPAWQAAGITELSEEMARGNMANATDAVQRLTGKPPVSVEQWVTRNRGAFGA